MLTYYHLQYDNISYFDWLQHNNLFVLFFAGVMGDPSTLALTARMKDKGWSVNTETDLPGNSRKTRYSAAKEFENHEQQLTFLGVERVPALWTQTIPILSGWEHPPSPHRRTRHHPKIADEQVFVFQFGCAIRVFVLRYGRDEHKPTQVLSAHGVNSGFTFRTFSATAAASSHRPMPR
jgi:hypothetical protein